MNCSPESWDLIELKKLFSFVLGGDWGKDCDFPEEGYEYAYCIRGTEFKNWKKDKGSTSVKRLIKKSSLEKRTLMQGDILVEISGGGPDQPVGRTVLIDKSVLEHNPDYPKVCTNFLRLVRTNDLVDSGYLNHYLNYFYLTGEVVNYQGGSNNLRNLKFKEYETIMVPVAPKPEQLRIADLLDEIITKLEMAKSRLENIPKLLNRFRKIILELATSGELTEEWSSKNEKKWHETELINLILAKPRNGKSPKGVAGPTPYRNLTLSSITQGTFIEGCFKYVNLDIDSSSHLWVKNGDLLIQRANSIDYVGVSALYEGDDDKYVYPDLIMKCRANSKVLPKYLHLALSSEKVRKYFRDNATGTAGNMPKINQVVVSAAPICYPELDEQAEIVRKVGELFELANAIERKYEAAKLRVDKLTQSILARAFRGELFEPFTDKAERLTRTQSTDVIDAELTTRAETTLEQVDITRIQAQPKPKVVDDKSELLSQLKSAPKAMTAQQLFDSSSVETFKAIDEL
ncbi:MAG: restriction endonuclease subunit S, partial [Shewanella sp.]|nr:restriction endonuclease subunit S [Shewanella sp.]